VLSISPQRRKELLLEQLVGRIARLAAQKPVLIVLEDAHWIDPTTQELFDILAERIRNLPVLLIITYRPEFTPPWLGQSHVTVLTLNRLGRRHHIAVIRPVAKGKDFPTVLLEQIVATTDGLPLFIGEMTKSVWKAISCANKTVLTCSRNPCRRSPCPRRCEARWLPGWTGSRPRAVVRPARRWDVNSPPTSSGGLRSRRAELEPLLRQLVASELVHQRGAVPHAVYTFKHALVQDAAYGTMLRASVWRFTRIVGTTAPVSRDAGTQSGVLAHHCTGPEALGRPSITGSVRPPVACSFSRHRGAGATGKTVTLLPDIRRADGRQQFNPHPGRARRHLCHDQRDCRARCPTALSARSR
jgi:hypothetical protein